MPAKCGLFIVLFVLMSSAQSCQQSRQAIPDLLAPETSGIDYMGTWSINDTENQLFNIIVRPDRTVVSNWSKGTRGAWGERGTWKRSGSRIIIKYGDGWTDVLMPSRYGVDGVARQSFRPGTSTEDAPTSMGSAVRVEGRQSRFCGVFEIGQDDDFVSLLSSGLAYRSDGTEVGGLNSGRDVLAGTWSLTPSGVTLSWADGQQEQIEWQRGVYVLQPGSTDMAKIPDAARMLKPVDGLAFGGSIR